MVPAALDDPGRTLTARLLPNHEVHDRDTGGRCGADRNRISRGADYRGRIPRDHRWTLRVSAHRETP